MNDLASLGRQFEIDRIELDPDNTASLYGASLGSVALDERDELVTHLSEVIAKIEQVLEAHGPVHTGDVFDLLDGSSELIEADPIRGSMLQALVMGHSSYCQSCADELKRRNRD